jgi:hypothetical protein
VFQQEQDVADFFFFAESDQLLLQAQTCGVVDCAELDYGDQILCHGLHGFTRIKKPFNTGGTEEHRGMVSVAIRGVTFSSCLISVFICVDPWS